MRFFKIFEVSRGFKIEQKRDQNRSKNRSNFDVNLTSIFGPSWRPTWVPKPSQNEVQEAPKSMKNRCPSWCVFCMPSRSILWGFWAQHGPKWASKRDPKSGTRTALWRPFWASWGSWGLLGPKSRFWSIFDRFLIDFWRFLVDFWTIFWRFLIICWWLWASRSFKTLHFQRSWGHVPKIQSSKKILCR